MNARGQVRSGVSSGQVRSGQGRVRVRVGSVVQGSIPGQVVTGT